MTCGGCATLSAWSSRWCSAAASAATPEQLRQRRSRSIETRDVNRHYFSDAASRLDPWSLLAMIECPVLILAGEDDPVCPLPVAESLASQLPAGRAHLVRLPRARHTIFRDRPDIAFPAVEEFASRIAAAAGG